MKWIGQSIADFITRFRSDVYLESIADHGSDPDRFLTIDSSTGKVTYRTGSEVFSDIGAASGDITAVVAGTNLSGGATSGSATLNVDDAFLVNDGSDTTTGTITAAGFTTTGTWTFDEYTSGTIGITTIQDSGTSFNDNDTSLMTAAAIADKVEAYGYSTTVGDITAVVAGTNLSGGATSGSATITLADASDSVKGAASFHEDDFVVSSGAVTLVDLDLNHIAAGSLVTESETIASNDNDTTLPTSAAVKDYVDKRSIRVYGNTIKILPSDFMANEDAGATKTTQFADSGTTGLKPGAATLELWAFADIPEGKKATHIDVYAAANHTIGAYEININASGIGTTKGTGTANTQLDITDVDSTATNYLGIFIATGATSNRIYGALITIADI